MSISTEYRGYQISYGENSDEWYSSDAGDGMTATTLSALKVKIDRMIAKKKKAGSLNFLVLETPGHDGGITTATEARITGYVGPAIGVKTGSNFSSVKVVEDQKVEAVYAKEMWGKRADRPSRRVIGLSKIAPIGPETDAAIAEANRLAGLVKQARDNHVAAVKAIPRATMADIDALVKISDIDPTGGL